MKMILEGLIPGVQDGDDAQGSTEATSAKLKQRFTDGFKKNPEHDLLIGEDQAVEIMRQGENQMKVSHRQKLTGLFFQPPGFAQGLAFGAVAVTAGVISRTFKAAHIAAIQVATQLFSPTERDGSDNFLLLGRHAMRSLVALSVLAKNIGQLGALAFLSCYPPMSARQH
jgi:hypothetical protein